MLNFSRPTVSFSLVTCVLTVAFLDSSYALAVNSVGDLKKVETQVQKLVGKTLPCTVCIVSESGGGSGSGVTVSEDGLVLTAAHVIQAAGEELFVIFPDGRRVKAKSLGSNRLRDAGMVQITEPGPYPFAELGKSNDLKRNDWCVSLGHAGGFQAERTPPVRLGRILVNDRFVVTDCTIIAGDSGGPLFDLEGRVIGIHSNIGESLSQNQHVPVNVFTNDWERMKNGESWGGSQPIDPRQVIMGVQLSPQPNDDGVVVAGITPDSPAERAGLETGDVITKINEEEMSVPADIVAVVKGKRPGDKLQLKVKRGKDQKDFELRLIRADQLGQTDRQPRGRRPRGPRSGGSRSGGSRSEDFRRPPIEDESPVDEKRPESGNAKDANSDVRKEPTAKSNSDDKKQAAKDSKPAAEDKEIKGRSIEELIREARRSNGRLKLTPEERERLQERFRNQASQFGQSWRPPVVSEDREWISRLMQAYEPVVAVASDSTYRVLVNGKQVALGTAVTTNTLLTKASEIDDSDFQIEVEQGELADGKVMNVFKRYDLALIQISDRSLTPVEFSTDEKEMPLGTFLASVNNTNEPAAIGLISVKTRELDSDKGFLGIILDKTDDGIIIRDVLRRSAAERAGLKVDDVILKMNQKSHDNLQDLIKAVGSNPPDQEIKLLVRRGDEELEITATLGLLPTNPRSRIERMNQMGSDLSETRSGFPIALQHDCPIEPNACGGPLVNLDGEVVGINIARAGRIKSYALPARAIQALLKQELAVQQPVN
ncbi:MAG: trypsin-like peptidase domain-containing protein [Pirellulaceae bacterium]